MFPFLVKPRIQPAPSILKALLGQTVTLPCVVQGEPKPEISWFHNGQPVGKKNSAPLKIQHVSLTDQGIYQCVARNSAGLETLEINLEVLGKCCNFKSPQSAYHLKMYYLIFRLCLKQIHLWEHQLHKPGVEKKPVKSKCLL